MSVIRWEVPPPDGRGRGGLVLNHNAIAACLRRHPARWALIAEGSDVATGTSGGIVSGAIAAYRPVGAFEAVRRHVNGVHRLYARYVPDPSAVGGERSDNPNGPDLGGVA